MEIFIYLFVILIFIISLLATNKTATKPNRNILLGVTLPYSSLSESSVINILKHYKSSYRILFLISFVLAIPLLINTDYPSFSMIYMSSWIIALLYFNNKIYLKYYKELYTLKQKNNWFTGITHLVTIDTEVSKIKNKMPISKFWFIPSFVISFIPLILVLSKQNGLDVTQIISSLISVVIILPFIYLYKLSFSGKTVVYSSKSEINMACNYVHKRQWSICWVLTGTISSIGNVLIFVNLLNIYLNTLTFTLSCLLPTIISMLYIFYTHKQVREIQNKLLQTSEIPIYADDDEYWKNGFYYNPNDSNTMVEKRIGYGFTYNLATKKGKWLTFAILSGTAILLVSIIFMMLIMDTSDFKLSIDKNVAKISAPMYGYSFNIDEIKEIKKIDTLPNGSKTNGASTNIYNLGNYNLHDYGKSKMYIYKKNPPFIVIKLDNTYIFINGKTKEITDEYYKILLQHVNPIP